MPAAPEVVAVFNTSEDTTDMLRVALEQAGFVVITAFTNYIRDGRIDFEAFIRQHAPKVIVYDIAVPYEHNWALFRHLCTRPAVDGIQFVVTTTNVAQVEKIAGGGHNLIEIVGKPYDLDLIVRAVKEASRARPTR
jgi:DNA-binding response OmpR family regulator